MYHTFHVAYFWPTDSITTNHATFWTKRSSPVAAGLSRTIRVRLWSYICTVCRVEDADYTTLPCSAVDLQNGLKPSIQHSAFIPIVVRSWCLYEYHSPRNIRRKTWQLLCILNRDTPFILYSIQYRQEHVQTLQAARLALVWNAGLNNYCWSPSCCYSLKTPALWSLSGPGTHTDQFV